LAKKNNTYVCIIYIPQRIEPFLLTTDFDKNTIDPFALGNRIKKICHRLDIGFLDFMEILTEQKAPESLYYPVDGHLTPEGQNLLGRFIASRFLESGILGKIKALVGDSHKKD
jgi:hypothetical protein